MITPRTRAAGATLLLSCLTGAAAASLAIQPRTVDTCANPAALFDPESLGLEPSAVALSGGLRRRRMDGYLTTPSSLPPLAVTVRRTFELPNWLIRPTTALPGPAEPDRFAKHTLQIDGQTAEVQFSYAMHRHGQRFAAYVFGYRGEPTLSAFWLRMFEAPAALLEGARPITYFGVASEANLQVLPLQEERALDFLEAAWRHYQRACVQ